MIVVFKRVEPFYVHCDDKMHAKHTKKEKLSLFPLPSVWIVFAFLGEITHLTLEEMGKL